MLAYDIAILDQAADRGVAVCHGWCFGLPPGIQPPQWPLDPANGYPLQHSFTLLLPEDHRCHGPEFVAVSFFASALEHNDGGPLVKTPAIRAVMNGADAPADPDLLPFWHSVQSAHPRLHRFEDRLGTAYAAMLLTQAEFDGPACLPPRLDGNRYRDALRAPAWLRVGSLLASEAFTADPQWIRDTHGEAAPEILAENRALRWSPRANDPNAGRSPVDESRDEASDYIQPLFRGSDGEYQDHDWVAGLGLNHLGGTMQPSQWTQSFSPHYIEFEEAMGGFNFGGGNAQLDLRDMKFEWACG